MTSTRSATGDESDDQPIDVVEAAVRFVASQCGEPVRVLAIYHLRNRGLCAGCTVRPTRWLCSIAVIAMSASKQGFVG
jgi:hypothetical protein